MAARRAAMCISEEGINEIKEILELTEFYAHKRDIEKIEELDHRFHDLIYVATNSRIMKQVLSDFHIYIQKTRRASLSMPGRIEGLLKEHTAIFEAIKRKNGEEAERLMENHVHEVGRNMHLMSE